MPPIRGMPRSAEIGTEDVLQRVRTSASPVWRFFLDCSTGVQEDYIKNGRSHANSGGNRPWGMRGNLSCLLRDAPFRPASKKRFGNSNAP